MPRYVLMKNGIVENAVMAAEGYKAPPGYSALPSETANIGDMFVNGQFVPHVKQYTKDELIYAAEMHAIGLARVPHEFDLGDGVKAIATLQPQTRTDLRDLASWGAAHPTDTRVWQDDSGGRVMLTGAQFATFSAKVSDAYMILYDMLDELKQAITAGTVLSIDQFDTYMYVADVAPGTF